MRLSYDVKVYPFVEYTEWYIYYLIEPLLYNQPFLRPAILKRWKQPHGTICITDTRQVCIFTQWLLQALQGGRNIWHSPEPPDLVLSILPASQASYESVAMFKLINYYNPNGNGKPSPDDLLFQWSFDSNFFSIPKDDLKEQSPFIIQQWVSRNDLEHWIDELQKELTAALIAAGVKTY
jgi:hypothetical protein